MSISSADVQDYRVWEAEEGAVDRISDAYDWCGEKYDELRDFFSVEETEELYETFGIDKINDAVNSAKNGVKQAADRFLPGNASKYLETDSDYHLDSIDIDSLEAFEEASRDREDYHKANLAFTLIGGSIALSAGAAILTVLGGGIALADGAGIAVERYNRLRSEKVRNWLDDSQEGILWR